MKKAVILLSGGLDSATTLYYAKSQGYTPYGLIFNYGQRHGREIRQAKKIARAAGCACQVMKISFPWKGSSLLDKTALLPRRKQINAEVIPATYVPGRNIIFLSFAVSFAEVIGARAVFIGANAVDYSGYPDCRPAFIRAYQKAAAQGMKSGVEHAAIKIQTPLIRKTKAQIIRLAFKLNVPLHLTWSCYEGGERPCGRCESCRLRQKGFVEAGRKDPSMLSE